MKREKATAIEKNENAPIDKREIQGSRSGKEIDRKKEERQQTERVKTPSRASDINQKKKKNAEQAKRHRLRREASNR